MTCTARTCCKGNYGGSISRTVGTIFIERIADIVVIFGLALAAGFWSFRGRNRPEVDALFLAGFVLAPSSWSCFVVVLRYFGGHLTRFLPDTRRRPVRALPRGQHRRAARAACWCRSARSPAPSGSSRALRVFFVIRALDLPAAQTSGISAAIFVALARVAADRDPADAGGHRLRRGRDRRPAVALRGRRGARDGGGADDSCISTLTVIVIGGVFYAFSAKVRRAHAGGVNRATAQA